MSMEITLKPMKITFVMRKLGLEQMAYAVFVHWPSFPSITEQLGTRVGPVGVPAMEAAAGLGKR